MSVPTTPAPLMLPGQAAAPEGPADLTMMYVLHHAFRRDLDDFVDAAGRLPIGDREAWRRLADRWATFGVLLHDHHTKEDKYLWPLLIAKATRADDHAALDVLAEMEAEHASIDPLLASVSDTLQRLVEADDEEARAALVVALARTRENLGGHLSHEERDAIAILQRHVGGAEWAELEAKKFRGGMTFAQVRVLVPWAYKGLSAEATAHVDKTAGPPFRLINRLGRKKFLRSDSAAFGLVAGGRS
ncbi:hemerythrin domain-containing protein [Aeromicrobium sp. UC242_57]|uniref:hemerythrin domain-containing protein n=1 Tax=Aeromicrobium sp. UC242_57 TaxID=3374624 RepID=UPI00379639F1